MSSLAVPSPLERLRRFLVRFWPHACALCLAVFWGFAELQSWHDSLSRPYTASFPAWWGSRLHAPIQILSEQPTVGWTLLLILAPLILLHAIFPRWYWAAFSLLATFAWFLWGTVALTLMGVTHVG